VSEWSCVECNSSPGACKVPIQYDLTSPRTPNILVFNQYKAWAVGDTVLDWNGAEQGQGSASGRAAAGSPSAWTTYDQSSTAHHPLNRYRTVITLAPSSTHSVIFIIQPTVVNVSAALTHSDHTVCQKNAPTFLSCSSDKHGHILIIFGQQHQHTFKNNIRI